MKTLKVWRIYRNGDLKSAVVVGLRHNYLKIFPHWGRMNFWLTVLTGISDPRMCLGFGVHSLHAVMCLAVQPLNSVNFSLGSRPSWRHRHWCCAQNLFFTSRDKFPCTSLHWYCTCGTSIRSVKNSLIRCL